MHPMDIYLLIGAVIGVPAAFITARILGNDEWWDTAERILITGLVLMFAPLLWGAAIGLGVVAAFLWCFTELAKPKGKKKFELPDFIKQHRRGLKQ